MHQILSLLWASEMGHDATAQLDVEDPSEMLAALSRSYSDAVDDNDRHVEALLLTWTLCTGMLWAVSHVGSTGSTCSRIVLIAHRDEHLVWRDLHGQPIADVHARAAAMLATLRALQLALPTGLLVT